MTPFKSILAATDFSASANNAVHQAAMLAQQHAASLVIVHVVSARGWFATASTVDRKSARGLESLRGLAGEMARQYDVSTTVELRTGDLVDELRRASASASLLVLGQRHRNRLSQWVPGRIAQRLVEQCHRPVLVVKQMAQRRYHRALVPVDFTPAADAAIVAAASLAPRIDLHIFHALESTRNETVRHRDGVGASLIRERQADEEVAVAARLRRTMARRGLNTLDMRVGFGRGVPAAAALRQARTLGADLMVATRQRGAQGLTAMLGSIESLLARSQCDMLIVPGRARVPRRPQVPAPERSARAAGTGKWPPAAVATGATPSWTCPGPRIGIWGALVGR